jgi:NAD(P)H-hydrate epimerase
MHQKLYICSSLLKGMKLFSTHQIRDIDRLTIHNEPVSSIDLMERAAVAIFRWFAGNAGADKRVVVFAGPGNNGGDGLALARMLVEAGYYVDVFLLEASSFSSDYQVNLNRLKNQGIVTPYSIKGEIDFPNIDCDSIIIDALFGSGLKKPLEGLAAHLIDFINGRNAKIISIDMPSGLFGEENLFLGDNPAIKASVTLTLQFPKLSFFFAEHDHFLGKWIILPIGLNQNAIDSTVTQYFYIDSSMASSMLKARTKFSHKGDYGHCLVIAGSKGMIGAAVLSSAACIKSGSGLVTVHVPQIGYPILQQSIPEVMVESDESECCFTSTNSLSGYSATAIGPGIGKAQATVEGFRRLLKEVKSPLVIDADGLNILAENQELIALIPPMTVITPHPGEFDRLFGKCVSGFNRLKKAIEKSAEHNIVIVSKGAFTQVVCPDGQVYFNSTGNSGMSTGGSGDVLTGVITSLLGQGYDPVSSSILGVYVHGLAGDIAAKEKGMNALTATDIVSYLGDAFNLIPNT